MAKLILLRGNSASGKTTLATQLQAHFGTDQCFVLHQDWIRRELLQANDHPGTPAVALIEDLLDFGARHYQLAILEGILRRDVYGAMLLRASQQFEQPSLVYYLDLPFTQTWQRNLLKARPFTEAQLKSWWLVADQLTSSDRRLTAPTTADNLQQVLNDWQQINQ